jgi:hypothetical protein
VYFAIPGTYHFVSISESRVRRPWTAILALSQENGKCLINKELDMVGRCETRVRPGSGTHLHVAGTAAGDIDRAQAPYAAGG